MTASPIRSRWTDSNKVEFRVLRLWSFADVTFCPAMRLTICIKQSETEHAFRFGKLRGWLDGGGKSPNEQVMKSWLREPLRRAPKQNAYSQRAYTGRP